MVTRTAAVVIALAGVASADPPSMTPPSQALPEPEPGFTAELAMGPGVRHVGESTDFGLGLSGSFGRFVSPSVAVSLRVSGLDRGGYTGVVGPHVQVWLGDDAFIGAGGGLGFYALCDPLFGCTTAAAAAGTARIGLVASRIGFTRLSLSLEVTAMNPKPAGWIETYSLLIGGQTF